MNEYPLVSVITGYYNRKENLKESIQSVLDQDYPNFEYIIFDDCSNDGTRELLEELNDSRIRLILHNKNRGFTIGLIGAIHRCKGDYIALHGAGDISYPSRLKKQISLMLKDGYGMVGCYYEDVLENGVRKVENKDSFSQGEILFDKDIYIETGGYNKMLLYGQFTQLKEEFTNISTIGNVDEILYRRINYSNGTTNSKSKMLAQRFYVISGEHFAKGSVHLAKYDKNKTLEKAYYKVLFKKSANKKFFFDNYDGNILKISYYKILSILIDYIIPINFANNIKALINNKDTIE